MPERRNDSPQSSSISSQIEPTVVALVCGGYIFAVGFAFLATLHNAYFVATTGLLAVSAAAAVDWWVLRIRRRSDATSIRLVFLAGASIVALLLLVGVHVDFSQDEHVINFGVLFVTALGLLSLVSILYQERRAALSAVDSARSARMRAYHELFGRRDVATGGMRKLYDAIGDLLRENKLRSLTTKEVEKLRDDHRIAWIAYINGQEAFSGAVLGGLVDDDYAFEMEGVAFVNQFAPFAEYILGRQQSDPDRFVKYSQLAMMWCARLRQMGFKTPELPLSAPRIINLRRFPWAVEFIDG